MKNICLLIAFSSSAFAQFTHIEMTQTPCQNAHCFSSPAVSNHGDVYFLDTQNGTDQEHGTSLMTLSNGVPISLINNQNEPISHIKIDIHGKPLVKIGDSLLRYPGYPINSPIFFSATDLPANIVDWKGDVSYGIYYSSVGTCVDNTSVSNKIVYSSSLSHIENSTTYNNMSEIEILADSCKSTPESFVATDFIKVSKNNEFKIYSIFTGNSPNSRMYLHQDNQNDLVITDDAILAEVNNHGFAVWTKNINDQIFVYQQNMNDLNQPPVLLDTIIFPVGNTTDITALSINNSGDIAYLIRNYQFSTQTFSFNLKIKSPSSLNSQSIMATGDVINGKVISEIRWDHHGINEFGVLVSSIRYTDSTEAMIKSLTREPQNIGFDVANLMPDTQGVYHLGFVSNQQRYQVPDIVSDVPVHQNYEVTNSFMRSEDEYFEQGISDIDIGNFKSPAITPSPPEINVDELTVYHQITQTNPNLAIAQAQTVSISYLEVGANCSGRCIGICISNTQSNSTVNFNGSNSFITTYQRLVTEQLESSPAGNYYLNIYFQNYIAIRDAVFSEPLSFLKFKTLFESWQPAVENLLDGDGTYAITAEMSENLNSTLDLIERVSNPQLKKFINNSRNNMNLYTLPGKTIGSFMANEFENSFEDLIFVGNFE